MQTYDEFGELALGSRLKALSDTLYTKADLLYKSLDLPFQGRWFPVVASLHRHGEMGVTELARAMGQTHSAISQLSQKLDREGLIQSRKDPRDERKRLIQLTAAGRDLVRELTPVWQDIRMFYRHALETHCPELQNNLSYLESMAAGKVFETAMQRRQRARQTGAIQIIPYQAAYQDAFFDLNARWIHKHFVMEAHDEKVLSNPEAYVIRRGGMVFFALFEHQAIGTCAVDRAQEGVFELTKMGVDPEFQALGIGRKLAERAIDFFRSLDATTLYLESSTTLPDALRLYEQLGFVLQPNRKPGSVYDRSDVYMIWEDNRD